MISQLETSVHYIAGGWSAIYSGSPASVLWMLWLLVELPHFPWFLHFHLHSYLLIATKTCFLSSRQNFNPSTQFQCPSVDVILLPVLNPTWRVECLLCMRKVLGSTLSITKQSKTETSAFPTTVISRGRGMPGPRESLVSFPSTWTQKTKKLNSHCFCCCSKNI